MRGGFDQFYTISFQYTLCVDEGWTGDFQYYFGKPFCKDIKTISKIWNVFTNNTSHHEAN